MISSEAGYAFGVIMTVILAFFAFVTVTFMVEAMSLANAAYKSKHGEDSKQVCGS